jgi:predicted Zn-dependent protease
VSLLTAPKSILERYQARQDDLRITDWQLCVSDSQLLSLGIKDRELGGVYAPPSRRRVIGGRIYVIWHDGKVSQSSVDSLFLRGFEERLRRLRRSAYEEAYVHALPEDSELPEVAVYDEGIRELMGERSELCFQTLATYGERLSAVRQSYDGGVEAGLSELRVANSKGLDRQTRRSAHRFSAYADSLFGVGYGSRRELGESDVARRLGFLNAWLPHFHAELEGARAGGAMPVLLLPGAAASFLGHFVLGNLDGERVANGGSAWTAGDFDQQRALFGAELELRFDPTTDWLSRSYRMDARGLMAEPVSYIEGGRLKRPVTSLKAARQLSCLPTPVPPPSGLSIETGRRAPLEEAIAGLERGIVVPSVLGMHTQDASRGNYSLAVPSALVVEGGRIIGRAKASLAGNFFEDLGAGPTAIDTELDDLAGLSFESKVSF